MDKTLFKNWMITGLAAALLFTGGCASRTRNVNFTVDQSQVLSQLDSFKAQFAACQQTQSQNISANFAAYEPEFYTMLADSTSTLYYSAAPDMGPVGQVAPIDFRFLSDNPPTGIQSLYIYFLIRNDASGPHGSLLITGQNGGNGMSSCGSSTSTTGTNSTGTGTTTGTTTGTGTTSTQTSTTAATSSNMLMDFGIIGMNDGGTAASSTANFATANLTQANLSSDGFVMDINISGKTIRIRSNDVADDGSALNDVIQLSLYVVDATTGEEGYIGQINMMQPN